MTKLNLHVDRNWSLIPADDEARIWLGRHMSQFVMADVRVQRSPQHNRLFWAIAAKTFDNLPERFAGVWADKHDMVKGLQLAFGICDQLSKPTRDGWDVVQIPKSLDFANMDQDEFNEVSALLFKGMAHCLGVDVPTLLNESEAA